MIASLLPNIYNKNGIEQIKYADVNRDEPDLKTGLVRAFNTEYVASEDGWLYSASILIASANNQGAGGTSCIDVVTSLDGQEIYHNKAQCSWDMQNGTVRVATQSSGFQRIYKGQTYRMYQAFLQNTGHIHSVALIFYPLKKN